MALWGNNDAVGSAGTVSLDYSTLTVTGSGTSFGQAGSAQVGDVIRFGDRAGTYFGDAVVVSIASTLSLVIDSTAGLSGAAIAGTDFQVSQLPKYTVLDRNYSEQFGDAESYVVATGTASTDSPVGFATIYITEDLTALTYPIKLDSDTVGYAGTTATFTISALTSSAVTLGSTIAVGVNTGDQITFTGLRGGYDSYVNGVNSGGMDAAQNTSYQLTHGGWVGVTTYVDSQGNLRVKSETLVAMSGIQTGNTPVYGY